MWNLHNWALFPCRFPYLAKTAYNHKIALFVTGRLQCRGFDISRMMKIIRGQMASMALRPRRYGCIPLMIALSVVMWLTLVNTYVKPEESLIQRHLTNFQIFHETATIDASTITHDDVEDVQLRRKQSIKSCSIF